MANRAAERNDDDDREIERGDGEREVRSPGIALRRRTGRSPARRGEGHWLAFWNWSKTPPSAKNFACACFQPPNVAVDGDQVELRKLREIGLRREFGMDRTEVVLGDDRLRLGRIEKVEIGLGDLARSLGVDVAVDDARPAARRGSRATARRSRTDPCRIRRARGRRRSPRRSARRRGPAWRRSWSSRARRCRARGRSCRSRRRNRASWPRRR